MVINKKVTGRTTSVPSGLAIGASVSLLLTLTAVAILAMLVDKQFLDWENIGYGIMALITISSFTGAILSYSKIKRQRLMICLLSGFLYFGILLSITALFFGGQFESVGITGLLTMIGSGCAGLLGTGSRKGGKYRKKPYSNR